MITLFTTYKNFEGHFGVIQTNALKSWRRLSPDLEIILFDKNDEAERLSKELNAKYIPDVKTNEKGTPFLSEMFHEAQKIAKFETCCFINCDIMLDKTFLDAVDKVKNQNWDQFLMVGTRHDLDVEEKIDYENDASLEKFYEYAGSNGERHGVAGIDYFVFPRGMYKNIPPFLAGRAGFDNWLIWKARTIAKVIDCSQQIFAIHQNHDYTHLMKKNTKTTEENLKRVHVSDKLSVEGDEGIYNIQFLGKNKQQAFNILDATWKFNDGDLVKKESRDEINRYLGRLPNVYPRWSFLLNWYKRLYRRFMLPAG